MSSKKNFDFPSRNARFFWASILVICSLMVLSIRLWYLQIYKGEYYRKISLNNRVRRIEIPAYRGMIYDRNAKIVLGNRPFFDLVYIPQYIIEPQTTIKILSQLIKEPPSDFEDMLRKGKGHPKFLPITIKRNLSLHEVSIIEANRIFLPGIEVHVAPRREYTADVPPHIVGYLGEIDGEALRKKNEENPSNSYLPGDLIGKQGLESRWEDYLRGERGYRYLQVDAFGRQTTMAFKNKWELPEQPALPGSDLVLTIDIELQKTAKNAFQGKYGAIVALDPNNGEILTMISSPDFDPTIYQESLSVEKWQALISDPFKPLFDKTTGGTFAPGSVYKPVVALAALQEGVINANSRYTCLGSFELGRDTTLHCHQRRGHGTINLAEAIIQSCDIYLYNLGMELGVDRIAKYAQDLGLGQKLDVNLNKEDAGLIPTSLWKKETYGIPWTMGDNLNIAIGQGSNLLTPMQIASLYATLANGGKIWRPFLVKKVVNHFGEVVHEQKPQLIRESKLISEANFALMRKILTQVVSDPRGSGRRARVEGVTVAGKTGSAQVVGLDKNKNRQESVVSMKWQEHAIFAAFSPAEKAEIVVAIVSENDSKGGGGVSAAPVAQKIIAEYWRLKNLRKQENTGFVR